MKKAVLALLLILISLNLVFAITTPKKEGQLDKEDSVSKGKNLIDKDKINQGIGQELSKLIKERKTELKEGNYTGPQGQLLKVREIETNLKELRIKNTSFKTELNISLEEEQNQSKLKAHLSNGRKAEIKILPETASQKAREKLGELGFNISLKEAGKGDKAKLVYEFKSEKQFKLLKFIKMKAKVSTDIDAESGEIVKVKKPWWAFLASEN